MLPIFLFYFLVTDTKLWNGFWAHPSAAGRRKITTHIMAIHRNTNSMIKEALKEMIEVSEYCINFDKSKDFRWPNQAGCYGYPSAILLLCIVDSVGTLIEKGGDDIGKHFQILNNPEYYNLKLSEVELRLIEKEYRNRLTHNSHMPPGMMLYPGNNQDSVLVKRDEYYCLNLRPFLEISKMVVKKILTQI